MFDLAGIEWPLVVALIVVLLVNFLCLFRGIQSIGKVS